MELGQREVEGTDLYLLEKRAQEGEKRANISGEKCHFRYMGNNQLFSMTFKDPLKTLIVKRNTHTQLEPGYDSKQAIKFLERQKISVTITDDVCTSAKSKTP